MVDGKITGMPSSFVTSAEHSPEAGRESFSAEMEGSQGRSNESRPASTKSKTATY